MDMRCDPYFEFKYLAIIELTLITIILFIMYSIGL
jgi:hypothetical protein